MDPSFITAVDWPRIFRLVHLLWFLPLLAIGIGFFFLLAHAVIPSLVTTQHLSPQRGQPLRRLCYTASLVSLALLGWVVFRIVSSADIISGVYPRWWT